jgi:methylmalonyl-CoA mutase N-terminal domain/subunit
MSFQPYFMLATVLPLCIASSSCVAERFIAESAQTERRRVNARELKIVGVTDFVGDGSPGIPILQIGEEADNFQVSRLKKFKSSRDFRRHAAAQEPLSDDARTDRIVMRALIAAARSGTALDELMQTIRSVFDTEVGGPEFGILI